MTIFIEGNFSKGTQSDYKNGTTVVGKPVLHLVYTPFYLAALIFRLAKCYVLQCDL